MFLRRNRRIRNGETYEYWSLMRTVRTAKGPRHELVANLGKAPGLDQETRHGWESVADFAYFISALCRNGDSGGDA